jgi:hypothetical protein
MTNQIERLVMLRCACGCDFERKQTYFDQYEECRDKYPSAARYLKRKIEFCDSCISEKINKSLKALPEILKALAT